MSIHTVASLSDLVATDEAFGIVEVDAFSSELESEFDVVLHGRAFEGQTVFESTGASIFICTNGADKVIELVGEGVRCGFFIEKNPVTHPEIDGAGGHDFAVIGQRYIVDPWISLFTGAEDRSVYDLHDPKDAEIIKHIYGDVEKWSLYDPVTKSEFDTIADAPSALRPYVAIAPEFKASRHMPVELSLSM